MELVSANIDPEKIEQVLTPEAVSRLELGADDILVISAPSRISMTAAERIKSYVEAVGIKNKILVVEDGLTFGVIRQK